MPHDCLTNQANRGGAADIAIRKRFALGQVPLPNDQVFGCGSEHVVRKPIAIAVNNLCPAIHARSHHTNRRTIHAHGIGVRRRERDLTAAAGTDTANDDVVRIDLNDVCAEARDRLRDGLGRAATDFHHGDDGGNADDDPQNSERRSHDVATQCVQRDSKHAGNRVHRK